MTAGSPAFAAVGTDFHPFDRLVSWVDRLALETPEEGPQWLVQHGATRAPLVAQGKDYLDNGLLQQAFADAPLVVTHAGPATVTEARRHGHLPIVVPRDPAYGEHVDDHQLRFARKMHEHGLVVCCETERDFRLAIAEALANPEAFRLAAGELGDARVAATVERFAALVDPLMGRSRASGPTVLYLGGFGRSGSTLFERLIGEAQGVCVLGEVVHLWERGLLADERCGCSLPFSECPQWRRIGEVAFGGWDRVDVARVLALKARVDRNRFIPLVASAVQSAAFRDALREYVGFYRKVYAAAAQVTGATVVVDSSKHASLAYCLTRADLDLRVLHVVRDSPGVSHSWSKRVRRPEAAVDEDAFMPRYSTTQAAVLWDTYNLLFEVLRTRPSRFRRVSYEQLLADPCQTMAAVAAFAGIPDVDLPSLQGGTVHLSASHTVAGNPMRFTTGEVQLSADDSWRSQMPSRSRLLVAALTAPLRVWYGYGFAGIGRRVE